MIDMSKMKNVVVDADAGDRIIALVIQICSRDRFALLQDFPWYVRTLVDLAHTPRTGHGAPPSFYMINL